MEQVELGDFEKRIKPGGQYVLRFEKKYYFLLKSGLYYKAGHVHNWSGDPKGIGLNPHLCPFLEDLVIENRSTENCYIVNDLDVLKNNYGEEVQKGKKLYVFPLSGFKQVEVMDKANIPEKLKT